jgi:O-antigen/teichoic acid export membrane protein
MCCQIFALTYFDDAYVWWLILELVFAIIGSISLEWMTRKTYPYLRPNISKGKQLYRKYPEIGKKIKQVFFHKIGGFALTQSSPIIIYAYASLTLVALYGNYMLIITGVTMLMNAMFNSMNAGVGNLVAEGNKERIMSVFEELFGIRFILVCTLCFAVYTFAADFITLWIGEQYVLDNTTLALMVATLYITLSRSTVDAFIAAYGLYEDTWSPIVEAFINIGLSVVLGYFYGLHGILLGVLISLFLVIFCWKPIWLFKRGFKINIFQYIWMYIKYISFSCITWIISAKIYFLIPCSTGDAISFIINSVCATGVFFICITLLVLVTNTNIRMRCYSIIKRI